MMTISREQWEGAPLLNIRGRLDGEGAGTFNEAVAPLEEDPAGPVLLDMTAVDYLSSAGIRSLLLLAKSRRRREERVWLIGMQAVVQRVIELAGLLNQFEVLPDRDGASHRLHARARSQHPPTEGASTDHAWKVTLLSDTSSTLERWSMTAPPTPECLALADLGLACGRAGLANTADQAQAVLGAFVALHGMVSVRPADRATTTPDFVVTDNLEEVPVYVAEAARLTGTPFVCAAGDAQNATLKTVTEHFADIAAHVGQPPAAVRAWIMAALDPNDAARGWIGMGVPESSGTWRMEAVQVAPLALNADPFNMAAYLHSVLQVDTIEGAFAPRPEDRVGRWITWLFAAEEQAVASGHRLEVLFDGETEVPEEWEWIARRLYADCSRVRLQRLCGGFSAATFQVESYDHEGRRLLPTVLKLADPAFSGREDRAYDQFVQKYILNNSAVRMGRCARNDWVGLRYNFLGITGPESRLSWIGEHFETRPIEESMPLFRELFEKILHPWYGQARPARLTPYSEHDPRGLFPDVVNVAASTLGINPDLPTIECPPLGRTLPNPYYVLQHVYAARAHEEVDGWTSIVHGDLNLNNVLLDEKENIYVIDFSETHIGDVGSDFARIEPLLLLQMTRMDCDTDLVFLLQYLQTILQPDTFFDPPDCYAGSDPFLPRAHALVCLLRAQVNRLTAGQPHPVPYVLGWLRWSLPIAAFRQLHLRQKQLSCYASALAIETLEKWQEEPSG